ncbi:MAG: D-alanyl-D-alanine carboxypeptidase [Clostridia bacterium]|nr:D-alanyl-D-alanine carboxypeptidase [Clostridia bacterium]
MKKIILFISLLVVAFSSFYTNKLTAFASNELEVSAKSAYLMDYESKTLIYSKNENERLPIASMTKIMLLVLAFEKIEKGELNLEQKITVSERASSMGGSQVFLQANKDYLVSDLIKSIIIASANDASVAIAEKIYGSESVAVDAMNEKAKQLKLTNTLFSNCTGLPKPTQYSCAKDVAMMLAELCKHPNYFNYSGIYLDELVHPDGQKTVLTNTNKLSKFYAGCDGGKTGFTNEAGYCLAATAKRGSMRIVGVLINESNSKTRFADCSKMFDYCFENYDNKQILSIEPPYQYEINVDCGKKDIIEVMPAQNYYIFGKKNYNEKVTIDFEPISKVKAPIKKGDNVGVFKVYKNNVLIAEINALACENLDKKGILDYAKDIAS